MSLAEALYRGSIAGIAAVQGILVVGVLTSDVGGARLPLLALHSAIALGLLWGLTRQAPAELLFATLFGGYVADYACVVEPTGVLASVDLWLASVTTATPVLLLRGRRAVLVVGPALILLAATPLVAHPDSGRALSLTYAITAGALVPAALSLTRTLRSYADRADAAWLAAEAERRRVRGVRARARELAERNRILHDTVINTFAAIAAGGPAVSDSELVRQRCAQDAGAIESLLAGHQRSRLFDLPEPTPAFRVTWTGLSTDEFERHASHLPIDVSAALRRATAELVRNAEKHSGADEVRIDAATRGGAIIVTVSDDGVGFDPEKVEGWGLRESVLSRAHDAGIRTTLETGLGRGTAITLIASETPADDDTDDAESDPLRMAGEFRRTAAWLWSAAVNGAELLTVALVPTREIATVAMIAVVAGCCSVAWWCCRGGRLLPRWLTAAMVLAMIPAFVLGFAGTGDGRLPYLWQPISLTPLLFVLLVTTRSLVPVGCALAVTVATAVVVAVGAPATTVVILAVGTAVQFAQFGAVVIFVRAISMTAHHAAADRERSAADHVVVLAAEAAAVSRERWTQAGVRRAVEVLRSVASGATAVDDPELRRICAVEESYLRQSILIGPELFHLGTWFARALADARLRQVALVLRLGSMDAADADVAGEVGRLALDAVAATPSSASLTVTWLVRDGSARLLLVGPPGLGETLQQGRVTAEAHGRDSMLVVRRFEDQDLVEAFIGTDQVRSLTRPSLSGVSDARGFSAVGRSGTGRVH